METNPAPNPIPPLPTVVQPPTPPFSSTPPIPPPNINQPINKSSSFVLNIFRLFGLIIIIFIGYLGFNVYKARQVKQAVLQQLSPSPTPFLNPTPFPQLTIPSDWKTYRNEALGFELKYPKDLSVLEKPSSVEEIIFSTIKQSEQSAPLIISVRVDKNEKDLNLTKWVDGLLWTDESNPLFKQNRREQTQLGGIKAERIFSPGEGSSWKVIALHNDLFYSVNIGTLFNPEEEGKDIINLDTFNQILSTFKFIE